MPMIIKHRIAQQIKYIRVANVMSNTTRTDTYNSDNINDTNIKTLQQQIMTTNTNRFLKFRTIRSLKSVLL